MALFAVGVLGFVPSAQAAASKRADARLDAALKELVASKDGPPGAAALVDRGGRPRLHRAGVGVLDQGRRYRRSDRFRVASVAKAFSGAVALGLVERGVLSLDSTIGQLLPGLPAAWSAVTLRQALGHTAQLPDYIRDEEFVTQFLANPRQYFSPLELIGFVADEPLLAPPGSGYHYSDTDNIVVALMAEAATGIPYETLLKQLVYGQLGLRGTSLPVGYLMPRPFVRGYDVGDGRPENVSQSLSASGPWASGGVVSTLADLNRFIRGYVNGTLFGGPVQAAQLQFLAGGESGPPGPGANSAGLGIFRYETRCGTVFGHTGNMPGYTTFIAASPDGRRSVAFSVNTQLSPGTGPRAFKRLRHAESLAVCAALG
jgi:D-alanyl-D-alanine carboxypeptidase